MIYVTIDKYSKNIIILIFKAFIKHKLLNLIFVNLSRIISRYLPKVCEIETCILKNLIIFAEYEIREMCSLLNKLTLAIKREHLSVIRDENKKESIFKTIFKLVNSSTDDELTVHILLVLLQVNFILYK